MKSRKGNFMVVGQTGSGKTSFCFDVLKRLSTGQQTDEWRQLRKNMQEGGENKGDEHHDNQQ